MISLSLSPSLHPPRSLSLPDSSLSMSAHFHPHMLPTPEESAAVLERTASPRPSSSGSHSSTAPLIKKSSSRPTSTVSQRSSRPLTSTSQKTSQDKLPPLGPATSQEVKHSITQGSSSKQEAETRNSSALSRVESDVTVEDIEK